MIVHPHLYLNGQGYNEKRELSFQAWLTLDRLKGFICKFLNSISCEIFKELFCHSPYYSRELSSTAKQAEIHRFPFLPLNRAGFH